MDLSKLLEPSPKMQRAYISGPMTGYEDFNRAAFHAAADTLRQQGYEVENPADIILEEGTTWATYMRHDLVMLLKCDVVFMLPDWHKSNGARLEAAVAHKLGMPVVNYPDALPVIEDVEIRFQRAYDSLWVR